MCLEGQAMAADVDLMERGAAGISASSVTVTDNQKGLEMQSHLDVELENNALGIHAKGRINGALLYVCLTTTCVVGGLSVLHLVGVLK